MPRSVWRQDAGPESQESLVGDAVPRNGVEDQAARRAHMREQTMARQAAERQLIRPAFETRLDRPTQLDAAREREADLQVELARIDAEHQTWLRERGLTDPLESGPRRPLPPDTMAPEATMERFIVILRVLRRGVTLRGWAAIFREVPSYAQVASRGQCVSLSPLWPVEFEGVIYDLKRPLFVLNNGVGIMRMVDDVDGTMPLAGDLVAPE